MDKKQAFFLLSRYLILAFLAFNNLFVFYAVFAPLTLFSSYSLLSIFHSDISLSSADSFFIDGLKIILIPACIAGSAYYLLLILNLSTPMCFKTRLKLLAFSWLSLFVLNTLRIVVFTELSLSNFPLFDIAHLAVWYIGSTLIIVLIWFSAVWLFKIRKLPVYSDVETLFKEFMHTA